jgi:hypothetical protein
MNEQSENHKHICDSNSYEDEICTEYFLNRSQICFVIEAKFNVQIAPFLNVQTVTTVQQIQWTVSVSWLVFL